MSFIINKTISTDFTALTTPLPQSAVLRPAINAAISTAVLGAVLCHADADSCDLVFDVEPSAGDKTAIDGVVAAHTGIGNRQVREISATEYTVLPSDNGCRLYFTAATAVTVTLDAGLGVNFQALWRQVGAGLVSFVNGTATIHNRQDQLASAGVKAAGSLVMSNVVDTIDLLGDTA